MTLGTLVISHCLFLERTIAPVVRARPSRAPTRTVLHISRIFKNLAGKTRPGTGKEITNWVHLDDIVGALEFIRGQQLGGIYNLSHDVPVTTAELLDSLFERHGLDRVIWDPSNPQVRPYNARLSIEKLKAAGFSLIHQEILF